MPATVRYAATIAYLGTGFSGWQRQPGSRTVQGELERALREVLGAPTTARAAGRTDAGVHAEGQVVDFAATTTIPPIGIAAMLAARLPADLRIVSLRRTTPGFDARRDASGKRYRYRLAWGPPLPPWNAVRTWELQSPPDLDAMRQALAALSGEHDFAAFALAGHSGTGRRGTVRIVGAARLVARGRRADLVVEGDGFLRGMVRRIAGALVEVGRGAQPPRWVWALLSDPRVRPPAPTAPAHGLTLERVLYRAGRRRSAC